MCKQQRNKDGEKKRIDYFNGKTQGQGCITLCSTVSDPIMFETWPIIMFYKAAMINIKTASQSLNMYLIYGIYDMGTERKQCLQKFNDEISKNQCLTKSPRFRSTDFQLNTKPLDTSLSFFKSYVAKEAFTAEKN